MRRFDQSLYLYRRIGIMYNMHYRWAKEFRVTAQIFSSGFSPITCEIWIGNVKESWLR